ncbi:PEP-CTERM sorting domain-containing protein [Aquabacterium lacunae]|uniref:PEP-CTERM sorting domain-containing protein n=1 Tax=Aquabacterium lacunae TaxID=2528630 RepID=A0A4Q9H371_9BURK|nr:PEP-CTERM sorting domain-containing protein [Aquabacterium lacunae]TBO33921.1 PEP-CTERM sorting domain-containing protein [Aquabacterium lacunae]
MTFKKAVVATGAMAMAWAAQAATVEASYVGQITGTASLNETGTVLIGDQTVQINDLLTGVLSFDDQLPREAPSFWAPNVTTYRQSSSIASVIQTGESLFASASTSGSVTIPTSTIPLPPPVNVVSASLNATSIVGTPSLSCPEACNLLTVTREKLAQPTPFGAVEVLSFSYGVSSYGTGGLCTTSLPANQVSSIQFSFYYDQPLQGTGLPNAQTLAAFKQGEITLNMGNGAGVFASIQSLSPVPEPSTWALSALGLVGLALVRHRKAQA